MFISAVLPNMSLYKLNSLPRLPNELNVIIVRKGASNSHRVFRVRRAVVLCALQWLAKYSHQPKSLGNSTEDGDLSALHSVSLDSMEDDRDAA